MKYQNGSLRKRSGNWVFRYRTPAGVMKQKTLKVSEYPSVASVKVALQSLIFSLNDPKTMNKTTPFGMVVERFIVEERLREIVFAEAGRRNNTRHGLRYGNWLHVPIQESHPT